MSGDAEIQTMSTVASAIEALSDPAAKRRVLEWLWARFIGAQTEQSSAHMPSGTPAVSGARVEFETFADLFDAAEPKTEKEKALLAAYWAQICQGQPNFPAQTLNSCLKDLGHGIGNITDALDALKDERPALVLQLKKSGTTKQARKVYKLTEEGSRRVRRMLSKEEV